MLGRRRSSGHVAGEQHAKRKQATHYSGLKHDDPYIRSDSMDDWPVDIWCIPAPPVQEIACSSGTRPARSRLIAGRAFRRVVEDIFDLVPLLVIELRKRKPTTGSPLLDLGDRFADPLVFESAIV